MPAQQHPFGHPLGFGPHADKVLFHILKVYICKLGIWQTRRMATVIVVGQQQAPTDWNNVRVLCTCAASLLHTLRHPHTPPIKPPHPASAHLCHQDFCDCCGAREWPSAPCTISACCPPAGPPAALLPAALPLPQPLNYTHSHFAPFPTLFSSLQLAASAPSCTPASAPFAQRVMLRRRQARTVRQCQWGAQGAAWAGRWLLGPFLAPAPQSLTHPLCNPHAHPTPPRPDCCSCCIPILIASMIPITKGFSCCIWDGGA